MNYQELQEAKQTFRIHALEKEYKALFKIRDEFVRKYNPAKIAAMTIDEYVQGKQSRTSFCYILERSLKGLGNMTGQYATKFGVWYSKEKGDYSFEPRLGTSYKEVFKKVKLSILNLLESGKAHDYEEIINNPLNALFKGKILAVYYPDDYLNIFSNDHLNHYLKAFDLDTAELMKKNVLYKRNALLDYKNSDKDMKNWSNDMFSVFLWSHYPKPPLKSDEVAVVSDEEEIEFPTLESFSFIDLKLAKGKPTPPIKLHSGKPSPDYEKEAKRYKKLGDRGEYIVYQAEVSRLMKELSITEAKAKKLIKWVSRESDSYGYDIQSVNKEMTPRYIEVKATRGKAGSMDFYYTENEYETSKKYGENYYIYVVYEILTAYPKIWMIKNPFIKGDGVNMKPVKYKVELRTEHE
ncbi:MAG: DUF3883 domain-containing protein [Bacteroidaceae bacterium]|nr:DUF3883 domain-containing protein [Bacteroidaceae bacterium]